MKKLLYILSITLMLSACQSMKNKMGLTTTGPDEYQVQRSKTLETPPHYDLPDPYKMQKHDELDSKKLYDTLSDSEKAVLKEVKI